MQCLAVMKSSTKIRSLNPDHDGVMLLSYHPSTQVLPSETLWPHFPSFFSPIPLSFLAFRFPSFARENQARSERAIGKAKRHRDCEAREGVRIRGCLMLGKMVTGEGQTYNREANGTIDGYCGRHHVKCMHWPVSDRNALVMTEEDRPYFFSLFRLPPPPLFWNGVKPVPICRTISGEGEGLREKGQTSPDARPPQSLTATQ